MKISDIKPIILELIYEIQRSGPLHPTGANILVGTIDPDDDSVVAQFGGTHNSLRKGRCIPYNPRGDFRFNDESRNVYWHEAHSRKYEVLVNDYIEYNLGQKVNKHITFDSVRGNISAYTWFWNDAHGLNNDDIKV